MQDRPDAATLLRAMATTLSDDVLPVTSGAAQHAVRVVANLCRILEREVEAGAGAADETRRALSALLARDGTLPELVEAFDHRLCENDEDFDERARKLLLADALRRLAIDRPGYAS